MKYKKARIGTFLGCAIFLTVIFANAYRQGWRPLGPDNPVGACERRDRDMDYELKLLAHGPGVRTIFIGDSIMQRWLYHTNLWNRYFGEFQAANLGFGGDYIASVRYRVRQGLLDEATPELIVLLLGTNDFSPGYPSRLHRLPRPDEVALDLIKLVDEDILEKVPRAKVLIISLLPRGESGSFYRRSIEGTNLELRHQMICETHSSRVKLIDIGDALLEKDGSWKKGVTIDGTHLTEKGYALFGAALEPHVARLLKK